MLYVKNGYNAIVEFLVLLDTSNCKKRNATKGKIRCIQPLLFSKSLCRTRQEVLLVWLYCQSLHLIQTSIMQICNTMWSLSALSLLRRTAMQSLVNRLLELLEEEPLHEFSARQLLMVIPLKMCQANFSREFLDLK